MKADIYDYPRLFVAVDIVIFSIIDDSLKVLLVKRGKEPYKDKWVLPGGFVRPKESLEEAALRELEEETDVKHVYLEQLYSFGGPKRDPRGRVITIAYMALVNSTKIKPLLKSTLEGIMDVKWHSVSKVKELGFDHEKILKYALKRLRNKLEYTSVGIKLLPKVFTLSELKSVYELILNEKIDKRNFRKKILNMDIVEKIDKFKAGSHRPAMLYKFKGKQKLKFKQVTFEK